MLLLVGILMLSLSASCWAQNVLYWSDLDQQPPVTLQALSDLNITPTIASGQTDFIDKTSLGGWDLVILHNQNWHNTDAQAALMSWVAGGGKAITNDWTLNQDVAAIFGAIFTGTTNYSPIYGTSHAIWDGVSSPIELANPGWGVWSTGINGSEILATFPNGDGAIVLGNFGSTILNGFLDDTYDSTTLEDRVLLARNEIQFLLAGSIEPVLPPEPGFDTAQHRRFWNTALMLADKAHRLFDWIDKVTGRNKSLAKRTSFLDPEAREVLATRSTVSTSGWYTWVLGKVIELAGKVSESWVGKSARALTCVLKTVNIAKFWLTTDRLMDSMFTMKGDSQDGAQALRRAEGYLDSLPQAQVEQWLAGLDSGVEMTYEEWDSLPDPVQKFSVLAQNDSFATTWVYTSAARELIRAGFPIAGYPAP